MSQATLFNEMITKDNYFQTILTIDLNALPEKLKQGHDFVVNATEGGINWEPYNSPKLKKIIDLHFSNLEKYIQESNEIERDGRIITPVDDIPHYDPQAKPEKWHYKTPKDAVKAIIANYISKMDYDLTMFKREEAGSHWEDAESWITLQPDINPDKFVVKHFHGKEINKEFDLETIFEEVRAELEDGPAPLFPSKPKPSGTGKPRKPAVKPAVVNMNGKLVERVSDEVQLIARYMNMHDKKKTDSQIKKLIYDVQRAILEKRSSKTTPYGKEIMHIQESLVKAYNKLIETGTTVIEKVKIDPAWYEKLKTIAQSEIAMLSISFLKRFLNLSGRHKSKMEAKKKAERLSKEIIRALTVTQKIGVDDRYYSPLTDAQTALNDFIKGKNELNKLTTTELSGLRGDERYFHVGERVRVIGLTYPYRIHKFYESQESYLLETLDGRIVFGPVHHSHVIPYDRGYNALFDNIHLNGVAAKAARGFAKGLLKAGDVAAMFKSKVSPYLKAGATNVRTKLNNFANSPVSGVPAADPLFSPIGTIQSGKTFRVPGQLGPFMGDLELNELAIVLEGDKGAGKTQLYLQIADSLADMGMTTGVFSLEMSKSSSTMKRFRNENIKPKNQDYIEVADKAPEGIKTIRQYASRYNVIVIDSWTKLNISSEEFDKLRKDFPKTIWIVVFQRNAAGKMRGGNRPQFDSSICIEVIKKDNTFVNNYAITTKNRQGPSGKMYHIKEKRLIQESMAA